MKWNVFSIQKNKNIGKLSFDNDYARIYDLETREGFFRILKEYGAFKGNIKDEKDIYVDGDLKKAIVYDSKNDEPLLEITNISLRGKSIKDMQNSDEDDDSDEDLDGMADNLSALELVSGAVVITVDNDEKVRKYYLAPSQAQVIIPDIVEMHGTSSGMENNLPVYQLTPSQSRIIMKKFEEMSIPEANFEDLKSEAGSPKPEAEEVQSTPDTQHSTQLADEADKDVIIIIEGKDKIHKYVLTPVRAQSIIQQVIALSKETAVVTKGVADVQEIKLPDNMVSVLITENNEEKHYILTDEDAEEIKGKLQEAGNIVGAIHELPENKEENVDTPAQLEGLADKDPMVQKANEINRAMKKLFNSLANPEEPYYYIALSKEYKKKGKFYESYYEPSWKKQKQSADPSHPAVSSVQESTVAGWLRRNFGLNFYKFKKNPIEEANNALGKREKKAGSRKPEARRRETEVPKKEEISSKSSLNPKIENEIVNDPIGFEIWKYPKEEVRKFSQPDFEKMYDELENNNHNPEAVFLLAKFIGTDAEIEELQDILNRSLKSKHGIEYKDKSRWHKIATRLWDIQYPERLEKKEREERIFQPEPDEPEIPIEKPAPPVREIKKEDSDAELLAKILKKVEQL